MIAIAIVCFFSRFHLEDFPGFDFFPDFPHLIFTLFFFIEMMFSLQPDTYMLRHRLTSAILFRSSFSFRRRLFTPTIQLSSATSGENIFLFHDHTPSVLQWWCVNLQEFIYCSFIPRLFGCDRSRESNAHYDPTTTGLGMATGSNSNWQIRFLRRAKANWLEPPSSWKKHRPRTATWRKETNRLRDRDRVLW